MRCYIFILYKSFCPPLNFCTFYVVEFYYGSTIFSYIIKSSYMMILYIYHLKVWVLGCFFF